MKYTKRDLIFIEQVFKISKNDVQVKYVPEEDYIGIWYSEESTEFSPVAIFWESDNKFGYSIMRITPATYFEPENIDYEESKITYPTLLEAVTEYIVQLTKEAIADLMIGIDPDL